MPRRLVLYTRAQCHLCTDMLAAAQPIAAAHGVEIEPVDIDRDPDLRQRYHVRIPVLELDGREVARYHLDPHALERALATDSDA